MKAFAVSLLVLSAALAAEEQCTDVTGSAAKGDSVLQRKARLEHLTLASEQAGATAGSLKMRKMGGVPVFLKKAGGTANDRPLDDEIAKHWIIALGERSSDSDVHAVAYAMGGACKIVATGQPSRHGDAFVLGKCTETDLNAALESTDGRVALVEEDAPFSVGVGEDSKARTKLLETSQGCDSYFWGLDRIDRRGALDSQPYVAPGSQGAGAHIYIFDTGIDDGHSEFGGRADRYLQVLDGELTDCTSASAPSSCGRDDDGHGTHCAGTAGGTNAGVAPQASIHGVKIMRTVGAGKFSDLYRALNWVVVNGSRPAVVSMSIGGEDHYTYIKNAIINAANDGVAIVVSAGNEGESAWPDACAHYPAGMPSVITVGATSSSDTRWSRSNVGHCVDIFAPGDNICSASVGGGYHTDSGTSMACPMVAGAAALLLGENANLAPEVVRDTLVQKATVGVIGDVDGLGDASPNLLLYVGDEANMQLPAEPACQQYGLYWRVSSGTCCIDQSDNCVVSPGYPDYYPNGATCDIEVTNSAGLGQVTALMWAVEEAAADRVYDYLTINGVNYAGAAPPRDVTPQGTIQWRTDDSVNLRGFRLCPNTPSAVPTTTAPPTTTTSGWTTATGGWTTTSNWGAWTTTTGTTGTGTPTGGGCAAPCGWRVTSGACSVDADNCITSPNFPSYYSSSGHACEIEVDDYMGTVHSEYFNTAAGDVVTINGEEYSGTASVAVDPVGTITWSSQPDNAKRGWKICPDAPVVPM